jgi:very-short-patch-repair endonuclease
LVSAGVSASIEEEVYKFLVDKGYNIATQVGCSGYRIDMAVKHPTLSGVYVIGIEYDGATYHSARTARERDRLREDVLRIRGWRLYRIWSTDWIKDPISESKRLINAIEEALDSRDDDDYGMIPEPEHKNMLEEARVLENISVALDEVENGNDAFGNGYGFSEYRSVNPYKIARQAGEGEAAYLARIIKDVVEIEGPIHFELLCQKMAPFLGREKVTSVVRATVMQVIKDNLNDVVAVKDIFCWMQDNRKLQVRVPASPYAYDKRKIEHICKEELAEAMYCIVACRFGIDDNDLFVETTKVFGYSRSGGPIKYAMRTALDYLIDSDRVIENDGKISIK